MPFVGQDLAPDQWGDSAQQQMKLFLREMYRRNEQPGDPYQFSNAGGQSYLSFEQAQWDLGTPAARAFIEGLNEFSRAERDKLFAPPSSGQLTQAERDSFSARLATHAAQIDQFFEQKLNADLTLISARYAQLNANPEGSVGKRTAQYLVDHPVMWVALVDYHNQLNLDSNGALMRFLQGEAVTLQKPFDARNPTAPRYPVTVSLAADHPGQQQAVFDFADYVKFYVNTWQARQTPTDGNRQANRFLADLDLFGPNWPNMHAAQLDPLRRAIREATDQTDPGALRLSNMDNLRRLLLGGTGGEIIPSEVLQAAYDQVRNDLTASAPPVNSQTFQIGTATVRVYYGPGTYSNSGNCQFVGIGSYGSGSDAGYRAAAAAGYVVFSMGGTNVYTSAYATLPPALAEGQKLLAIFESAIAAAEGLPNPNDQIGSQAVFPGTTIPLPASVIEAALDPNWASIAPAVAKLAAARLGLTPPSDLVGSGPTLLVNTETGARPPLVSGVPFVNNGWVAPGDGILVWDTSTLRLQTADAPGQTVVALAPNITLDGTVGNDVLWAGGGNDTLIGGPGDSLHGGDGNDVFVLGPDNVAFGGPGGNIYKFGLTDGHGTIYSGASRDDPVQFEAGIAPEDVRVEPRGWTDDLTLQVPKTGASLTLKDWYETFAAEGAQAADDPYQEHPDWGTRVAKVVFADGTVWDAATLRAKSLVADAPGETIVGFDTNDTLVGRRGHDELWAGRGADTLIGGPGDVLHGGSGSDVFVSGRDNVMYAGAGTTTVEYRREDGQDTLYAATGGTNTVELTGLRPIDLVFTLLSNVSGGHDLQVSVHERGRPRRGGRSEGGEDDAEQHRSSSDAITIANWDMGAGPASPTPVAVFQTGHGHRPELFGTDVGPLIQAMATFTADTGLSWDQAIERRPEDVEAILAPYWHTTRQQPTERWAREDQGDHGHGWSR